MAESQTESKKPRIPEEPLDVKLSRLDKDTAVDYTTIEAAEERAKSAAQDFNAAIDSVRRHVTQSVSSMAQSMRFFFWTVLAFWTLGGIGVGYGIWLISSESAIGFAIFWFAVGFAVLWNVRDKRNTFDRGEKLLSKYSSQNDGGTQDQGNPTLSLSEELASTRSLSKTIQNAVEKVAGTAVLLTPKLKEIIELRTVRLKQEHFIEGFAYSLSHYNLGLSYSEIQSVLSKRFWAYEEETYWLEQSVKAVREAHVKVSAPILKLIYHDSMNQDDEVGPVWQEICGSVDLRKEFALLLIQKKLLDAKAINESSAIPLSELLLGIKEYALATANLRATEFFDELQAYKLEVVSDLTVYGLEIKEDLQLLMDYMRLSASPSEWRNQVLDFAAQLVKENPLIIRLLVRDVGGDQGRLDAWRKIVGSRSLPDGANASNLDMLEQLAVVLGRKRITKTFDDFRDDVFQKHLVLTLKSYPDNFSSTKVEAQLRVLETQILRAKRNVEAAKRRFRLSFTDSAFLDEFVPSTLHSVEEDLVSAAAAKSDVNPKVFKLLYYSFIDPDRADELYLNLRGKSRAESRLGLLVEFLLSKKFIPHAEPNEHLETLFWTQEQFNLNDFLQIYYLYDRLHRSSSALYEFLKENAALNEATPNPHLGTIVGLSPPDATSFEDQLVEVGQSLIVDAIGQHQLSPSEKEELASAAAAITLKGQGDLSYKQLCMKLANHRLAPRILYEFANVDRINPNSTLKDATQRALDASPDDERHFNGFITQLELGVLHLQIGSLLEVQLTQATEKITSWRANILAPEQGIAFKEAIKDLFTEQINEEIVREFLTQQIISAYLITDPKNNPLIRLLDEKTSISEAQDKLVSGPPTRPEFRNLIQTRKGSGKGTRVGIVPFSMSFEKFSDMVGLVLQEAIGIYNPKHANDPIPLPDKIPCYLLRIFPSEHGMKEIMSEGEIEARPVALVRGLMEDKFGDLNEIKLLSLVQSAKTGSEGVKSVIRAIVDHDRSSILSLAGGNIAGILNSLPELRKLFESRKIDKALFRIYSSDSLSELCTRVAGESESGSEAAQSSFRSNLQTEISDLKTLPSEALKSTLGAVYSRLRNIGIGLTV